MQPKQLQTIKRRIKEKIDRGDFVTLSRILEIPRHSALMRYTRNNLESILLMDKIVKNKEALINRLKKKNV
jgi:hypothetical protein